MPIQQTHSEMHSVPQKLSKIETLRLARNYILAMTQTLNEGRPMELPRFIKILSQELSQTTANLLTCTLMRNTTSLNKCYGNDSNCLHANYVCPDWQDYNIQNYDNNLNLWYFSRESNCQNSYPNYKNFNDTRCWESGYLSHDYMYYNSKQW